MVPFSISLSFAILITISKLRKRSSFASMTIPQAVLTWTHGNSLLSLSVLYWDRRCSNLSNISFHRLRAANKAPVKPKLSTRTLGQLLIISRNIVDNAIKKVKSAYSSPHLSRQVFISDGWSIDFFFLWPMPLRIAAAGRYFWACRAGEAERSFCFLAISTVDLVLLIYLFIHLFCLAFVVTALWRSWTQCIAWKFMFVCVVSS